MSDLACMWDKSNCSVICTLFKITFLGKWDECGERPFLWPLTSFPDRHTYSVHSVQYCPVAPPTLNSSAWTSSGPVVLSDGWHEQRLNEVVEALAPNILVQFISLLYNGTSLHNTLSSCQQYVQLQSNFHKSLTGYIADVAGTFESLIWQSARAVWIFFLSSLLPFPCTCLLAAAVYPLWAFFVPLPSVLDIVSCLCLLLLSFPWLLHKSHQISISFSFAILTIKELWHLDFPCINLTKYRQWLFIYASPASRNSLPDNFQNMLRYSYHQSNAILRQCFPPTSTLSTFEVSLKIRRISSLLLLTSGRKLCLWMIWYNISCISIADFKSPFSTWNIIVTFTENALLHQQLHHTYAAH